MEKEAFINMVDEIKEDRELEKIFLNYFNRYFKQTFLYPEYCISLELYNFKIKSTLNVSVLAFSKLDKKPIDTSNISASCCVFRPFEVFFI